ncbi:hypothetical protein VFPPC_06781 [Pochonia chlamydosporia 170]|uniref:Rhodopsin domain-containing protein n=1 Tax=Pochonia chlamydosporia 170 TaxID=1380566 RepID=A0A179F5G3_METCM|nr:hypothetical protein VFPPC_06781 [Pochonia chlamydosporia 170]OAQ60667.1 hypothetical protein VFPPC_06781 [Pochonia chlamydosporia 170]
MATSSWQVDDLGSVADQACWALFAVTAVIVILRVICRLFLKRGPHGGIGLDDYITIFCVLVLLVTCVLVNIGSSHGLGRHMKTLEPEQIVQANRWNVIISSVLIWSFSLPKFAMVAILKRILSYGLKTTIVFWFLALSSQACILATSVWWWKQCTPIERGWDRTIEGTCAPVSVLANLGYFTSAYSAFLDIFFAMYPIPFVMRLNMPLKSRIAVSVALGLSALACIVSIYKLAIFGEIFEILAVDPTYPVPYLDILGVAEGSILLICASLPTLGPLVRLVRDQFTTHRSSRQQSNKSEGSSRVIGGQWSGYKGQKLDDGEHTSINDRSINGMLSSVDDIPLVSKSEDRDVESGNVVGNTKSEHVQGLPKATRM